MLMNGTGAAVKSLRRLAPDCRVDDIDMALLQEDWLQDNSLTQDRLLLPKVE